MKKSFSILITLVVGVMFTIINFSGCNLKMPNEETQSSSGITKATAEVQINASGLTTEQENIKKKLEEDNIPGAIKHLYIISAYSGQVIIYSTVDGKVTSSGKRLTPLTTTGQGEYNNNGIPFNLGNKTYDTAEVLQDDGTYGSSIPYLFWWDTKGVGHKHYVSGGQIVHISNQPLAVKNVIINMSLADEALE